MIKKKIMFGALAALFLSVGIFAATNLQEKKQVSDLTLANIEAMTEPITTSCCPYENGICIVTYNGTMKTFRNRIDCKYIKDII